MRVRRPKVQKQTVEDQSSTFLTSERKSCQMKVAGYKLEVAGRKLRIAAFQHWEPDLSVGWGQRSEEGSNHGVTRFGSERVGRKGQLNKTRPAQHPSFLAPFLIPLSEGRLIIFPYQLTPGISMGAPLWFVRTITPLQFGADNATTPVAEQPSFGASCQSGGSTWITDRNSGSTRNSSR